MTDRDKLAELRRLHEAATPGPWRKCEASDGKCLCGLVWGIPADRVVASFSEDEVSNATEWDHANADAVVAMRNVLPALLRIAEAARMVTTYGGHYAYCASVVGVTNCDCGYLELRAAMAELEKP